MDYKSEDDGWENGPGEPPYAVRADTEESSLFYKYRRPKAGELGSSSDERRERQGGTKSGRRVERESAYPQTAIQGFC